MIFKYISKKMQNQRLTLQRLQKEQKQLLLNPIEGAFVRREDTLNFHFVLYNLPDSYQGGYYHGKLQLHQNYPFSPPKLIFFTPSGRFHTNTPICTTFTNYHSEEWTTAWNVRTLVIATISFMLGNEEGYGCISQSDSTRKLLASQSMAFNLQNELFTKLFELQLRGLGYVIKHKDNDEGNNQNDNTIPILVEPDDHINNGDPILDGNNNNNKNGNPRPNSYLLCGFIIAAFAIAAVIFLVC